MTDETLLTIFVAVTAVAILIQTGILLGFYFLSSKLSRQAEQAVGMTRNLMGPLQNAVENLQAVAARISDFSSTTQGQLRRLEDWWKRTA